MLLHFNYIFLQSNKSYVSTSYTLFNEFGCIVEIIKTNIRAIQTPILGI